MDFRATLRISLDEGMRYVPFVVSGSVVLRIAKFPDFGFAGAFLVGAYSLQLASHAGLRLVNPTREEILCLGLLAAGILGACCGLLTSILFLYARLNALISGIVTMLVCYSIALAGSNTKTTAESLFSLKGTSLVGIFGLLVAGAVVALFCTRAFLRVRMVCARPALHRQLETNPDSAMLLIMLLGNSLSAISGLLCAATLGASSSEMADDKMFLALTSLILGESTLALLVSLAATLIDSIRPYLPHTVVRLLRSPLQTGANTLFLMLAAVLGALLYWIIFSGATGFLHISTDWNKLFLGVSIVGVLMITRLKPSWSSSMEEWTFQDRRTW